jgi:hypothetical protein
MRERLAALKPITLARMHGSAGKATAQSYFWHWRILLFTNDP